MHSTNAEKFNTDINSLNQFYPCYLSSVVKNIILYGQVSNIHTHEHT